MSNKSDGNQNTQSAKVLKLGLNISVSGDPGTDFEIVLDDNEQKAIQASPPKEEQLQSSDVLELEGSATNAPKHELEKTNTREVKTHAKSTGAIPKRSNGLKKTHSTESGKMNESENSTPQDTSIINKIKSTMEHFEKFSDHIKDIPRLRGRPLATSTPFSDKYNSKSESSLVYPESRSRKFSHLYDFNSRKEYFKSSIKPSPPDLFLKPLPAENYYMRGIYTRFLDYEPHRHYNSDNSLNKTSEYKSFNGKSSYDVEKYEGCSLTAEPPSGILKKSDSEYGDKQSTSSADSVKDIKIYQSGGILIMQNFKENMDIAEKKEISEFSAKLIENCNKLRMEVSGFQDEKPPIGNVTGEESKNSGKMVQFDLSSFESHKSKSGDSSSNPMKDESYVRMESSESASDCMKNKDTSPQCTSQSQDLTSLSTQENDSFVSNPAGTSPTYASSKKLEWDSGADVGYLNLDLTKENLSTIEKIVLKGLSSDGLSEENIVYEKKSSSKNRSKFTMERIPSDVVVEEIGDESGIKSSEEGGPRTEKPFAERENDVKSGNLRGGETERRKNAGRIFSGETFKGENRPKVEETKPSKNSTNETQPKEKQLELTDKSVNVNTLFDNLDWATPPHQFIQREFIRPSESYAKPTHKRLGHSPKTKVSKTKSRASTQRLSKVPKKPSIGSHITGPLVASCLDMGNSKRVYKKVEASPVLNEGELSREVDEIIIDQRFKIKQASGRETNKEPDVPVRDGNSREVKTKSRPISASSSSNNTVLPKSESEEKTKKIEKYADQMIQTSDRDCESVGVQAFASQLSSDCDFKSFRKNPPKAKARENVNVSSKNIQAFGLNSSLPKQLEHPTGTESIDKQNTKSTQFFGGPLNSLPNYHSNLVTKPGESCGRVPNVLKTKINSEVIRMREENEKNILANDASKPRGGSRVSKNKENKENLITQTNSRSQSNASHGKNSGTGSRDSEKKANRKGRKTSAEGTEPRMQGSDDVSSLVLTSEVLKVHGDSIDRNIIKEKYFRSQLAELERREMISRSTSMEIQLEGGAAGREYITTGCQYSPQSRGTSGGQEPEDDSFKGEGKNRKRRVRDEYARQNAGEGFRKDQNMETGDSLPSSTQTAHSWVPGMRNSRENSSGVGKARSFEYLPGHIYESSGNLREELPSETEQNLITSSSSESDTARGSVSNDGGRDSEGRNTLILENSTDNSHGSDDRLKILDRNLSELSFAVLKLSEKDAQVENMARSLLASLCSKSGCGDWLPLGGADTSKTEVGDNKDATDNGKHQVGTLSETSAQVPKEVTKEREEFSIACQTDERSPSPDPVKFFEERKALEKRISEEKKCQIKWIENEINHLNILRELLEKQSSPVQRKKKSSFLSITSNCNSKSEENYPKNISTEICPRPVTPVYGCTISLSENVPQQSGPPATVQDCGQQREREPGPPQYGLAVSLSGCSTNWRRVIMLPVGVQVSLKDTPESCDNAEGVSPSHQKNSSGSENKETQREPPPCSVYTQYPSLRKHSANLPGSSNQTDLPPSKCGQCGKEQCYCLNLSDKSYGSSSRSKTNEKRGSSKLHFIDEECDIGNGNQTSSSLDPEILEMDPTLMPEEIVNKNGDSPPDPSETFAQCRPIRTNCGCQNVPKRTVTKHVVSCPGGCQANISSNSEEVGSCRCSRVQIKKSSNNCHIIKIHGCKCYSPENNSCSLKRQSVARKTENQSCQTECEPVVIKDLISYPEISKATEAPQVKNSYDVKVGIERPKPVVKKMPCTSKTPYQVIHSTPGTKVLEKVALERQTSEAVLPANIRTSAPTTPPGNIPESDVPVSGKPCVPNCPCGRKMERVVDDHPRHYFLRIEEAEIDEPMEPRQRKNSLEVVTVTVPVKRAGKSKIYGRDVYQSRDSLRDKATGCKCCSGCSRNHREPTRDNEPHTGWGYQKIRAEKPSSPIRKTGPGPSECNSYEDLNFYDSPCDDFYLREPRPVSPSYAERPVNGGHSFEECICSSRNAPPSREIQNEYDSCKKSGNRYRGEGSQRERQNDGRTRYDGGGMDQGSECVPSQVLGFNEDDDCYDPEFYNYNKREFMTKSELLREEEKKRKVHQPSLQEYLTSNRPDFYNTAERRRQIISERANERIKKHNTRMECLMKMMQQCNQQQQPSEPKRIFTTGQMREQTMKRYRKLPEVTGKIADEKKKEEYRTNRLLADIFAKKLQSEALKGKCCTCNPEKP